MVSVCPSCGFEAEDKFIFCSHISHFSTNLLIVIITMNHFCYFQYSKVRNCIFQIGFYPEALPTPLFSF